MDESGTGSLSELLIRLAALIGALVARLAGTHVTPWRRPSTITQLRLGRKLLWS